MKYFWRTKRKLQERMGEEFPTVLFLHIPKNAGSSLSYHFKSNIGRNSSPKVTFAYSWEDAKVTSEKLEYAPKGSYISGHLGWTHIRAIMPNVFSIISLRDPVDRTISFYQYLRDLPDDDFNPCFPCKEAKDLTLEEFCRLDNEVGRRAIVNPQVRTLVGDAICGVPTNDFENSELLATALKNLATFDFVTVTEMLNEDLPLIGMLTKTHLTTKPPQRNVSDREKLSFNRTEVEEILKDRVALDQELYQEGKRLRESKCAALREGL